MAVASNLQLCSARDTMVVLCSAYRYLREMDPLETVEDGQETLDGA
jgi:hypothetical protein